VVVENLWKNNNAASTIERLCELATTTSPSIENPLSLSLDEPQLSYQGSTLVTYPI
jgi:Na+-translocating ferredoxin:NAD+ oxidoreductase RnfE subunit